MNHKEVKCLRMDNVKKYLTTMSKGIGGGGGGAEWLLLELTDALKYI